MALELQITGPDVEKLLLVRPGEAELVLGRDAACDIHLPDPQRNVSRRHLAVWNQGGELHFRVLSLVNGVDLPSGDAPPGSKGTLAAGLVLRIGDYSLQVRRPVPAPEPDPWAVFDADPAASDATLPRPAMTATPAADFSSDAILPEEDPFGDWGFESTFGPASTGGPKEVAQGPGAGELASFFKGLGLDGTKLETLSPAELEAAGRAVRVALEGLFTLYATRTGAKDERKPGEHGVVPVKDNNPLKTRWPAETKLQFLFGGRAASIGFVSPQRALADVVAELLAHDAAMAAAVRGALEATVQEFAPAALKERLLGSGSKLFEGTRAWEAYSRYYGDRSQGLSGWIEQLLDRHFAQAYLRESQRIKGETGQAPQ